MGGRVRERRGVTEEDQEKGPRKHLAEMVEFYSNEKLGEVKPMRRGHLESGGVRRVERSHRY